MPDIHVPKAPQGRSSQKQAFNRETAPSINYVIVIGIDEYETQENLFNCQSDCEKLINALNEGYDGITVYAKLYNQEATKANIINKIEAFCIDEINNLNNNLIIYYSGHGSPMEDSLGEECCLVAHNNSEHHIKHMIKCEDLKSALRNVKTLHLALILDCCYAGGIFDIKKAMMSEEPTRAQGQNELQSQMSRFAIASSRKWEKSDGGHPDSNSAFTLALIQYLTTYGKSRMSFKEMALNLEEQFQKDALQKVISGPLPIAKNNSGMYYLTGKETQIRKNRLLPFLRNEFRTLNYRDQKNQVDDIFKQADKKWPGITIISDNIDAAPRFLTKILLRRIEMHNTYNSFDIPIGFLNGDADSWVLAFIKANFPDWGNIQTLDEVLLKLRQHVKKEEVWGIRFQKMDNISGIEQGNRRLFVEKIAEFMHVLHTEASLEGQLLVFIEDHDETDYNSLISNKKIRQLYAETIQPVKTFSIEDYKGWYRDILAKEHEGDLIRNTLKDSHQIVYAHHEKILPGLVIKNLCMHSDCTELINELLNY